VANDAWEAMLVAHARVLKQLAATGVWREISMREYDVLYTLSKSSHPMRAKELARNVLLSQPALSRLVDRLVERGFVQRATDPADRRGSLLTLTDDGRDRQKQVGRQHSADVAAAMIDKLTAQEQLERAALCRKLAG
jgi:DNA-binding MarR family transcriptional regulator